MKIDDRLIKSLEEEKLNLYFAEKDGKSVIYIGYENGGREFPKFWKRKKEYIARLECATDEKGEFYKINPLHPGDSKYQGKFDSLSKRIFGVNLKKVMD